ncbi:MAG TPA: T9SS type A sorting domain-containing protein, partial [Rhodothermales bacterium]|nr:T9SS type A sorting domain-containing protein [Rhodothermales bacterium]
NQAERGNNANPRGSGIGGWEDGSDHTIAAGTGNVDLTLPPLGHFFEKDGTRHGSGDKAYNWRPFAAGKPDSVAVYFRVYMATQEAENKGYDPQANPQVGVRGDPLTGGPLDWGATKVVLQRESTDRARPGYSLYSGVAYYANALRGQTQNYKFFFGSGGWEDGNLAGNRQFRVPTQDTTLQWVYFGNTRANEFAPRATAAITFTTDLNPLQQIGIFDRASGDSIEVRGAFNGWDCGGEGAPDDCLMRRRPIGNLYDLQYTFVNTAIGSTQEYKYYVNFRDDVFRQRFGRTPPQGWEENVNTGGINRNFTFSGNASNTGTEFFQGILPGNVIPNGTTVNATFRIDMRPALTFQQQPFVPSTDSVFVRFDDPFWLFTQGVTLTADGNPPAVQRQYLLRDPDGDRIYEGTFPIRGATVNGIALGTYSGVQYYYQFGNATKGFYQEQGTGTSTLGRRRTRFVGGSATTMPSTYAMTVQPERIILDRSPLPFECNPAATGQYASARTAGCLASQSVGVTRVEETASAIDLGGVFPNPARGVARFRFALPQTEYVSLKVYDTLGREVANVVDGSQAAGSYDVTFNTSDLAAGVYVYRLTVGGSSVARTLVVAK